MTRGKRLPLVLFAILFLAPAPAQAQTPLAWSWFRATTSANDWWIVRGRADVTVRGRSFSATLWDDTLPNFARLSLIGTVRNGTVQARVTINNSDATPLRVKGRMTRSCWVGGGGREELLLSDGNDVIGLFREIGPGRCVAVH